MSETDVTYSVGPRYIDGVNIDKDVDDTNIRFWQMILLYI